MNDQQIYPCEEYDPYTYWTAPYSPYNFKEILGDVNGAEIDPVYSLGGATYIKFGDNISSIVNESACGYYGSFMNVT